jgi:hypothetical protein
MPETVGVEEAMKCNYRDCEGIVKYSIEVIGKDGNTTIQYCKQHYKENLHNVCNWHRLNFIVVRELVSKGESK